MSANSHKRQKQVERRAAKRKAKHHHMARENAAGLPERLLKAAAAPILHCWVSGDLQGKGMGSVCVSRQLALGSVAFAIFLVDRYCLGVKDAWVGITSRSDYDDRIVGKIRSRSKVIEMSPAAARKLVEGAAAYARGLGIAPHADYQRAKLMFGSIDPAECTEEFEFGKDGKPFFFAGPFDDSRGCHQILRTLERSRGKGGYDFTVPFDPRTGEIGAELEGGNFDEDEGFDDDGID